ncbi:MAG: response regulator [Acidobacteria bacterium]|nr:MAG: response regulator [Acidobacteriota bacterium]
MPHVVLADDSPTIRKVVELSFIEEDADLHCFANGNTALDYLRQGPVDVLLADVSLPGIDGYELCRQLKASPRTSQVPVILLAGTFDPFDIRLAESVGYHSYLTKPFATSQLLNLVNDLIRRAARDRSQADGSQRGSVRGPEPTPGQTAKKETGTVNKSLFALTPQQCRPAPSFVKAEDASELEKPVAEPEAQATPRVEETAAPDSPSLALRQEEIDQVVSRVMEKLPGEIRRILADVLKTI